MFGFDNYDPRRWLEDGILAVPIAASKSVVGRVFRSGRWAAKATLSAAFLTGGMVGASAELLPASTVEVVQQGAYDLAQHQDPDIAPKGYFERLGNAISATTPLPAQSTVNDPEFLF